MFQICSFKQRSAVGVQSKRPIERLYRAELGNLKISKLGLLNTANVR